MEPPERRRVGYVAGAPEEAQRGGLVGGQQRYQRVHLHDRRLRVPQQLLRGLVVEDITAGAVADARLVRGAGRDHAVRAHVFPRALRNNLPLLP